MFNLTADEIAADAISNELYDGLLRNLESARRRTDIARRNWADVFNGEATSIERRAAWAELEICKQREAECLGSLGARFGETG